MVLPTFLGEGDFTTFMPMPPPQLNTLICAPLLRFQVPCGEPANAVVLAANARASPQVKDVVSFDIFMVLLPLFTIYYF